MGKTLKINEIFESISGEAGFIPQGAWTTFIRLQKCNLSCKECDTKHSQESGGLEMSIDAIIQRVKHFDNNNVLITGGEPLYQLNTDTLIIELIKLGYFTQIETNGSIAPAMLQESLMPEIRNIHYIFDHKTPSSGMSIKMPDAEQFVINMYDYPSMVKFVIKDENDAKFSIQKTIELYRAGFTGYFIFSPAGADKDLLTDYKTCKFSLLNFWKAHCPGFIKSRTIFSLQIHKLVNLS